jgi:CheY-like chemotaxis protein
VAHVLLVEDETLVAHVLQTALEDEGHRVTAVGDGVVALAADLLDPADLLVTDLRMPRMGGRELVARLRERHPGLPVVVLSGYAPDGGGLDGIGAGSAATVMLSKPVGTGELAGAVGALLATAAGGEPAAPPATAAAPTRDA